MVASGAALAETKISGGMTLAYKELYQMQEDCYNYLKMVSEEKLKLTLLKQVHLNNGLKYAAGFSY